MLVLTRGVRESIQIGSDIVIDVERVEPNRIGLRVEAPSELWRKLEPEGIFVPSDQAGILLPRHATLCIGLTIRITLIQIADSRARLGIDSPRELPIRRMEAD